MKTISLRGLKEVLTEGQLKNILGGSYGGDCNSLPSCGTTGKQYCDGKNCGDTCYAPNSNGDMRSGTCKSFPDGTWYCKICHVSST